jgi:hypothetical protein
MIFIPPMEIATRIMTLIDNAKTNLVLVSPYINIDKWDKFKKCLQRAVDRGVIITIYARENADQNLDPIRSFKVNLILIKDLHAKIYLNESYAIASSQNLIQYSDSNSIDFGYSTETEEERNQLLTLINQYLIVTKPIKLTVPEKINPVVKAEVIKESNIVFFKDFEIKKIYKTFKEKYSSVRMNNESSYVFCNRLFPFADVMLREGFELRFKHNIPDYSSILEVLENLNLENNHYQYKKELKMTNSHPDSLIFIPQEVTDIQKLVDDYVFMANLILDKTGNKTGIEKLSEIKQNLNRDDINKMYKSFKNEFPDSNCKVKSIYLFSNELLSFADVLIDNEFKIKIEMDRVDFKAIKNILISIDFNYNYEYEKHMYQEYESRFYFHLKPLKFDDVQLLISDYIAITKEILNKTEKAIFKEEIGVN